MPFWRSTRIWGGQTRDGTIREFDVASLRTILTPTTDFFIRNHFGVPDDIARHWKLRISGQVRSEFEISYSDISRLASRTITATIECAGNGVGSGGVSTATWTGVPLAALLQKAVLRPEVTQIRLVGADRGIERSLLASVPFSRSIPLEKALHSDTLLAFKMNGDLLPPEHGRPLRAIVPGWYGMDSVKWLIRIEALDHEDSNPFMTDWYVAIRVKTIGSERSVLTRMQVKSLIVHPRDGEVLTVAPYTISGVAWAGENRVAKVEVSTDGGREWSPATFKSDGLDYTWVFWNYDWHVHASNIYTIMVRATDERGNTQPHARESLRLDNYELNSYHTIHCGVK
jgi:DMSO/TMAO reductase YedYZ molybdopterin-dependent catalytic subunit